MAKKIVRERLIKEILQKITPEIGATIVMEPEWNIAGQIIFKNGRKCYFKYASLDLNPQGASEIAKDKDYANFFMGRLGYSTIPGKTFFSNQWCKIIGSERNIDAAYEYAHEIGFPVIVKPNSGSQGIGVFKAGNKKEFYQAMRFIANWDRVALVQKPIQGKDYRIVVVDDRIISAYQRIPLNVTGDGVSSIQKLLEQRQTEFIALERGTKIEIEGTRIAMKIKRQKLTMDSVPRSGEKIFLLDNANLSSGGDSIDVTESIHPEFRRIAIQLTQDMGLRLCGVDLIINGDISEKIGNYWILEINASPGLDHYAECGEKQEKIVEKMYLEILKAMQKIRP